jgi:hypothetical protein
MTGFVLAEGTHQMPEFGPGRLWILIGRYEDGILRQNDHNESYYCSQCTADDPH